MIPTHRIPRGGVGRLDGALPMEAGTEEGFRWRLADEQWIEPARLAQRLAGGRPVEGVEILKQARNRLVVRIPPTGEGAALVAKIFPMQGIRRSLFRWRRYGPQEAGNLLEAARRLLPVPAVMGLGTQRRWGLVRHSIVLMEDLAPRRAAGQLLREAAGDEGLQRRLLATIAELFEALYRAGCHNIDVNNGSILLAPGSTEPARVIDFQYAWFFDSPSPRSLAFQAAYFARQCAAHVPPPLVDEWVRRLLDRCGLSGQPDWWPLFTRLSGQVTTRRQRRRMRPA